MSPSFADTRANTLFLPSPGGAALIWAMRSLCAQPLLPRPLRDATRASVVAVVGCALSPEDPSRRRLLDRCEVDLALCGRWLGLVPEVIRAQEALRRLRAPAHERSPHRTPHPAPTREIARGEISAGARSQKHRAPATVR